jgi:hypothetical protein
MQTTKGSLAFSNKKTGTYHSRNDTVTVAAMRRLMVCRAQSSRCFCPLTLLYGPARGHPRSDKQKIAKHFAVHDLGTDG